MNAMPTDWLGTIRQTFTMALVLLLCSLNAMPAWSAGSTLYQAPPFTSTEPPANVFMMLDDSGSMARHDLPTPVAITINKATVATKVTIKGEGAEGFGDDKALFSTGTSTRPITAAPRLVPHPLGGMLVIFGTGKLHDTTDGIDTASQGIYAILDKPGYTAGKVAAAKVKSLTVSTATDANRSIDTAVDWNTFMGWSTQLTGGERIISDPTADVGSLTVTSYAPSAALDPCNGGGVSYIYRFNFATGIVSGVQVTGVVGAVTPLTVAPKVTARSESDGVNISAGISAAKGGIATTTPHRVLHRNAVSTAPASRGAPT